MSARQEDINGFIYIEKNPISKVGVFPYLGKSINRSLDPNKIYWVYRPAEELAKPETIESFKNIPIVNDHTMLGKGATPAEQKGVDGVTGSKVVLEGDTFYSDLKIFSESMKQDLAAGKVELSMGYRVGQWEQATGTFNGQFYDFIQRDLRGNHIALVDEGRCGSEIAVLDGNFVYDRMDIEMVGDAREKGFTVVYEENGTHNIYKEGGQYRLFATRGKAQAKANELKSKGKKAAVEEQYAERGGPKVYDEDLTEDGSGDPDKDRAQRELIELRNKIKLKKEQLKYYGGSNKELKDLEQKQEQLIERFEQRWGQDGHEEEADRKWVKEVNKRKGWRLWNTKTRQYGQGGFASMGEAQRAAIELNKKEYPNEKNSVWIGSDTEDATKWKELVKNAKSHDEMRRIIKNSSLPESEKKEAYAYIKADQQFYTGDAEDADDYSKVRALYQRAIDLNKQVTRLQLDREKAELELRKFKSSDPQYREARIKVMKLEAEEDKVDLQREKAEREYDQAEKAYQKYKASRRDIKDTASDESATPAADNEAECNMKGTDMADEEKKAMTMDDVKAFIKGHAKDRKTFDKLMDEMRPAEDGDTKEKDGDQTLDAEIEKGEDEEEDKAKDAEEEEAKDEDEKKEAADAAIAGLRQELDTFKKNGMKTLMSEISKRNAIGQEVEEVFGTFDHAEMTADEVASYGLKKAGIKAPKGQESAVWAGFVAGRKASRPVLGTFDHRERPAAKGSLIEKTLNKSK